MLKTYFLAMRKNWTNISNAASKTSISQHELRRTWHHLFIKHLLEWWSGTLNRTTSYCLQRRSTRNGRCFKCSCPSFTLSKKENILAVILAFIVITGTIVHRPIRPVIPDFFDLIDHIHWGVSATNPTSALPSQIQTKIFALACAALVVVRLRDANGQQKFFAPVYARSHALFGGFRYRYSSLRVSKRYLVFLFVTAVSPPKPRQVSPAIVSYKVPYLLVDVQYIKSSLQPHLNLSIHVVLCWSLPPAFLWNGDLPPATIYWCRIARNRALDGCRLPWSTLGQHLPLALLQSGKHVEGYNVGVVLDALCKDNIFKPVGVCLDVSSCASGYTFCTESTRPRARAQNLAAAHDGNIIIAGVTGANLCP